MKDEGNKDFWIGTAVGVGVGLLGYYMFTQIKPAAAASLLPTTASTNHAIVMDGSTFSVAVKIGDTVTLQTAANATSFSSFNINNATIFNGDITNPPYSATVQSAGTALITVVDSAGKTTALTIVAS
jgi:hypothetical protein